ncbi:TPA: DUF3696 domain-containing protein [Escherichia coli]|uniref:DUF3696 domain-containing protein n=3 Tax=Escherichia coli TaxID=562 RepID=UPI0006D13456|nr:DUF3696 domain-containing protein [Escherichia coli]EKK6906385.1 DUF3696 domain-containing protein [Shigella sonnei]ELP2868876.1 DUF3696 domain-containing protein [Escherichia coli O8]EEY6239563.1 DUF3696 domain-containing protein [Escherichia coli]EFA7618886.1 DUF3696 domain-containing protein [Escherichia coli]EFC6553520.1 DUF3696 domain-containing protein [Escherichia coli]
MLSNIKLNNFKSFSSETEIPLAPITLIYGPNSSGKSSIIQSLLALKQTLIGNNKNGEFISSGECLDLGDFESVISNHDLAENLSISIAFKNGMNIKEYNDEFMFQPIFGADDIRHFSTTYKYSEINPTTNLTSNKNYLSDFKYTVTQSKSDKKIFGIDVLGSKLGSFSFDNNGFDDLATFFNRRDRRSKKLEIPEYYNELISAKILISPILSIPIYSPVREDFNIISNYFNSIAYEIRHELLKINYLGPLRTHPRRFYSSERENVKKNKGQTNLGADLYYGGSSGQERVNYWMNKFDIPYKLSVENIGNNITGNIISLMLCDTRNNTSVTPADVGFGIGQVLPIITCAVTKKNQTICVEQPEIHLHPRLQAHLADLFIETSSNADGNQWIIETHSEALMLRLQRRIREKKINKNSVKVLYVDVGMSGTSVMELPLDDEGDFLKHWPEGFFEERMKETMGID